MPANLHTQRLDAGDPAHLERAAHILREGGTVAFPTETVYGLGANALDPVAVEKIFAAKQRPHWDPLIVHISDPSMLSLVASPGTLTAQQLMARFWPGPLTLLLPRAPGIADIVTAGRPLVGVRQPAHAIARHLIAASGVPIAAPSANTFGHVSPTTAAHVLADLDGRIDAVLDGGACDVGLESTVVEITPSGLTVYRPGGVTLQQLDQIAGPGRSIAFQETALSHTPESLPSPGVGMRHYAPRAQLILCTLPMQDAQAEFSQRIATFGIRDALGVMLPQGWHRGAAPLHFDWGPWNDLRVLASRMFAGLRTLDEQGASAILCPLPQAEGLGLAILDRLLKAARGK